jgi:hypothetical protein
VLNEISSGLIEALNPGFRISSFIFLKSYSALSSCLQLMQASKRTLKKISSGVKFVF